MVLLALGMAAAALLLSCCFSFNTSDDSYYLPRVMEILSQNRLDFPQGFIWSGISNTSMPENVDASTLELWKAYWSHLFGMHPTIFSRNTLTVVIHFVSWCSLYQAFRSVTRHSDTLISGLVFLFVYLMLLLLDNQHSDVPFWIIRFPSQGKSILLSIIYPAIIYGCAGIVELGRKPIPWTRWGILSIVFTAGIASSIIGGTMLSGGSGNIIGTLFGVLSLSTIKNIVSSLGLDEAWWTNITVAAMICLFLVIQSVVLSRKNKAKS